MIDQNLESNERFYNEIHDRIDKANTRYGLLIIIFGIIITQFSESGLAILTDKSLPWYSFLNLTVVLGLILFCWATIKFLNFIWPREVAHKGLPKKIYDITYNKYVNEKGKSSEEATNLIKYTELNLLESANESNYNLYKKKRAHYYHTLVSSIICVFLLTPSYVSKQIEDFKINHNEELKEVTNMSNDEQKRPDPNEILRVEPEMIKEGKEKPSNKTSTESTKKSE